MNDNQLQDGPLIQHRKRWIHGIPSTAEDVIVSLEDLRQISPREHALAREVAVQVRHLIAYRQTALESGLLDPEIDLPGGNWELDNPDNDFMDAFRLIMEGEARTLNLLRYYTGFFQGFRLIDFAPNAGLHALTPPPDDVRAAIVENLPREQWDFDIYMRMKPHLPLPLLISPPWMMGEVGRNVDGILVNRDTTRFQAMVATLWYTGILDHLSRQIAEHGTAFVVEIGAGYGALCYHLKRILPQLTYVIVDLPEALLFSGTYLALTMPECQQALVGPDVGTPVHHGITLAANYAFRDLLARLPRVDLALNYASLGEMAEKQVECYARELSARMPDTGLILQSNAEPQEGKWIKTNATETFTQHFAFTEAVKWTRIVQFDGTTFVHSNCPPDFMMIPCEDRTPLLQNEPVTDPDPVVEEPSPPPLPPEPVEIPPVVVPSRNLWEKLCSQPLHRLPVRIVRKLLLMRVNE